MTDAAALKEAIAVVEGNLGAWGPADYRKSEKMVLAAARLHLATLPRTKTVNVWRVEYAERHHVTGDWLPCTDTWPTEEYIRRKEDNLRGRSDVACIRVTGPHTQEVPEA